MLEWERERFRAVNAGPEEWAPLMRFLSSGLDQRPVRIALVVLVLALVLWPRSRRGAVEALVAFPLANELTDLYKWLAPQRRPFQELPDVVLRAGESASAGTASAHSANMMAVATVMLWRYRGWGLPWLVLALAVGYSRAYVGVHYPRQVLLGWLCGFAVATLVVLLSNRLHALWLGRKRRAHDAQRPGHLEVAE